MSKSTSDHTAIKTPYGLISRYRGELMGFAALWVVLFHSPLRLPSSWPHFISDPINMFINLGYGGVDLFILVSGIGIYQSLIKNSPSRYIKNRVQRIYPIWIAFIVVMLSVFALRYHEYFSFKEILGYLTFFGHWSPKLGRQGNWYVYTIMLFYVLAPVIFFLLRDSKKKALTCAVLVGIVLLGTVSFMTPDKFTQRHLFIAFSRLPLFIVGLYFSAGLKDHVMKALDWIICIALFIIGTAVMVYVYTKQPKLLWRYGLWWYPFLLIAPTMALLLSKLCNLCERGIRHLLAVLRFFGKASLEVFLISNFIFKRALAEKVAFTGWKAVLFTVIATVAGIVFHLIVKYLIKLVTYLWQKARKPKATES